MASSGKSFGESFRGYFSILERLLTFRASREELLVEDQRYLYFGIATTWIVGIGRFWDNPSDPFYRHLGIGSVAYIFFLALILFTIVLPYKIPNWTYKRVLTFVAMTAPPGLLYAIPAQSLWGVDTANVVYAQFLAVVATWRVSLLFFYLRRFAGLGWFNQVVCSLLPLSLIVSILTMLNLDKVVFDLMSGTPPGSKSARDASYTVLFMLTTLSMLLAIPLLLSYIGGVMAARKKRLQNNP